MPVISNGKYLIRSDVSSEICLGNIQAQNGQHYCDLILKNSLIQIKFLAY